MNNYNVENPQQNLSGYQDTSREAYKNLKDLNEKQQIVYEIIRVHGPMTNMMIAEMLGWTINRVTPRTNELVNIYELVIETERKLCIVTEASCIWWGIKS